MRVLSWSRSPRPARRLAVLTAGAALVAVPLLAPLPARADTGAPSGAGATVVGQLVQGYADPTPEAVAAGDEPHEDGGLLSWVRTSSTDAVRVPTDDVADVAAGSTVAVTLGAAVRDEASADGMEQARDVLAAEVVAPPVTAPTAPAVGAVNHQVTVVLVQPGGTAAQRAADTTTLAEVVAAVNGPVADFWSSQTSGAVRFGVTQSLDWTVSPTATCSDPYSIWDAAAGAAGWTPGPGRHLLVYVPGDSPGCAYGLGTVASSTSQGGYAYVQDDTLSVIAHEFGHNLGLGHSSAVQCDRAVEETNCATQAYADYYDVMGFSWGPVGALTSGQAARVGALPAANQRTVGAAGGVYELSPLDARAPAGTWGLRLVDSRGTVYWLEYRAPSASGRDSWLGTSANLLGLQAGVLVRTAPAGGSDTSLLLDGTPSAASRWNADHQEALPLGTAVPVARGEYLVTVRAVGATATVSIVPRQSVTTRTVDGSSYLDPGESLSGDQRLQSPDGRYRAVAQSDGNLVVYGPGGRVLWASATWAPGARLVLQTDGNLVLYATSGRPIWDSRTWGQPQERLVMQDNGDLVLWAGTRPLWSTGWDTPDRLRPEQALRADQALWSASGRYRAVAQSDGNLVVYAADGRVLWASGTWSPGARTTLQSDGNVVVYSAAGRAVWDTRTWGAGGTQLVMQDNGDLVLWAGSRPVWSSGWDTPDRLRPGQALRADQTLWSPTGRYRAVAQTDGNLVVYRADGRVVWASGTYSSGSWLVMQGDGNLVSYAGDGRPRWSSGTWWAPGSTVLVTDTGALELWSPRSGLVWRSPADSAR